MKKSFLFAATIAFTALLSACATKENEIQAEQEAAEIESKSDSTADKASQMILNDTAAVPADTAKTH